MEKTPLLVMLVSTVMFVVSVVVLVVPLLTAFLQDRLSGLGKGFLRRTLDDLVKLSAVQPDSPALGTKIDFHTLPLRHLQGHLTYGAVHKRPPGISAICYDFPMAMQYPAIGKHARSPLGPPISISCFRIFQE
jgi:hypothetical protein